MMAIVWRTIFFYFFVSILYRLMGKREIGQLGLLDLVVSLLIAELGAISIEKFNDNLEYLELIRRSFNNNVETFSNQLSTMDLSRYVKEYISDDDYIELCDVMLEDGYLLDNLADNHLVIENKRIEFNSYLDSIYNVVIFLRDNYDNYTIINDEIIFSDSAIEDEYYTFVRKAKHFEK